MPAAEEAALLGALLGPMPIFLDPLSINTRERGEALATTLGSARAALLRSHGTVVVGADLVEAFVLTVYLEQNAYRQYMASRLGSPYVFSAEEVAASEKNLRKPSLYRKAWEHFYAALG